MRKYFFISILVVVLMVGWIVAYMTSYNAGLDPAKTGPWFANTALANDGWAEFQRAGCAQCHTILGQQGQSTGPDLTYVGKRWKAPQIEKLIRDPRSIFPNTPMPAFTQLSGDQVSTIARYLESLQ